jgi:hypothetical protein
MSHNITHILLCVISGLLCYSSAHQIPRNESGRIIRSQSAKQEFKQQTGFPKGRPGYVIDHIIPLKRGGCDDPCNMQWQTKEEAKEKDKWE